MRTTRISKWILFNLCLGVLIGGVTIFPFNQGTEEANLIADISNIRVASSLNEGTDQYALLFITGGAASWFYTDNTYYYGGDSIQSGLIGDLQSSYVQTAVTGPGSIQFRWLVLSEINGDLLNFYIDSILMDSISGYVAWPLMNYTIASGSHTLKWEYSKNGAFSYSADCGWIDDVRWSGPTTTILYDDITLHEYYNTSTLNYYYQTDVVLSSYYHCVWLQPGVPSNNFNLYLYSDNSYSNLSAASTREAGNLDWVLFRPSSSQSYYPKTERNLGSGDAYIQWEDSSSSLSLGNTYSGAVNSSECIELYNIYLSSGNPYRFTLDVPSGGDYDLYLYSLSSGTAANYTGYCKCSENAGSGADEMISTYLPDISDYFAVMVVWKGGSGPYSLTSAMVTSTLSDDIALNETYSSGRSYYYQTGNASSSYYHCVWLQPALSSNDFNLYLFSDSSYSTLWTTSTRGPGYLDWVIFRPSSSQSYYPKVNTSSGSGTAHLQWEDSSNSLSLGTYSGAVNSSECIEIYMISISSTADYNFILDVPSEADYDLYLYSLSAGGATNSKGYSRKSNTTGTGVDEVISTYISASYVYAIIVTWKSGSGSYNLSITTNIRLSNDFSRYEYYNSGSSYYYQTRSLGYNTYQCVWVQPVLSSKDFNLYLYSDPRYSSLMAASTRGAGLLDWVMFRTVNEYYFQKVKADSGNGYAYIQYEDGGTSLSLGSAVTGAVSSTDCIELYQIYFWNDFSYKIELGEPSTGDYDLYIYSLSSGAATSYSGFSQCSVTVGNGLNETIGSYVPSFTGGYGIVVAWRSGSGSYSLKVSRQSYLLANDIALYDYYGSSEPYYYQTGMASSAQYHCVWLQPTLSSRDFSLYLYSDASYNNLLTSSCRSAGYLDWVLFRPSANQLYYPKAYVTSLGGYGYIEWEENDPSLSIGIDKSGTVCASEAIELYRVYLSSSMLYTFTLDVPSNADYDLYLYSLNPGGATSYSGYSQCSVNVGNGTDETISDYTPLISDYYAVTVVWKSGNDPYYLRVSNNSIYSPQFQDVCESLINPTYLQNQLYQFNCTWIDDMGIDTVIFTFNGVNYTNIMNASSEYFYTLVDLPANNNGYPYRWLAKDTSGNWGVTPTYFYVINKKIPEFQMYLNSRKDNCIINQSECVNITGFLVEPSNLGNFTIYINGSARGSCFLTGHIESVIQFPEAGNYNITCAFLESQNLTRIYQMYWLKVRDTEPPRMIHFLNLTYLNCTALQYYHLGLRIAVTVSDNVLVSHVILRENSTGNFVNRSAINSMGNVYWMILSIKGLKYGDFLAYWFYASDTSNNWRMKGNLTDFYILRIQDFIQPGPCNIDSGNVYPPNFVLANSLFTVSGGSDFGGSRIDYYQYKWDLGQWENGTRDNYSGISNGIHTLFYRAVDNAGNSGICQNITVYFLAYGADYDNDGLTNFAEIFTYRTNLFKSDTDGDGLLDFAEIIQYKTNPNNPDTDSDGVSDGTEISLDANPLDPGDPLIGRISLIIEIIMGCILSVVIIRIVKKEKNPLSFSRYALIAQKNQKLTVFQSLINALPSLQRIFVEKEKIKIPMELLNLSDEDLFAFFETIIGWVPETEIRTQMGTLLKRKSIAGKKERLATLLINLKEMFETTGSPINRDLLNRFMQLLILIKTPF